METCFAWKINMHGEFECSALEKECDGCNKECRFYKTIEQAIKDNARKNTRPIKNFGLFIDGRKHRDFETITECDDYLKKFWQENTAWENARCTRLGRKDLVDDWQAVFFNHNIYFAHKEA